MGRTRLIREERDPTFWAEIANHPEVRPHIGGEGQLEFAEAMLRADIIPLAAKHCGFLFVRVWPGRYELHTLALPEGRGRAVLDAFAEASTHMFTATDCNEILTKAPDSNRPAKFMARRAGFRPLFRREAAWSDASALNYYVLTLDEWLSGSEVALTEGRSFHALLEAAKIAEGCDLPTHPDDDAHDRAAGASSLMLKAGQTERAVWSYNRWAAFSGYQDIELISETPPVIDARDAVVGLRNGELEVLTCRGAQQQR